MIQLWNKKVPHVSIVSVIYTPICGSVSLLFKWNYFPFKMMA